MRSTYRILFYLKHGADASDGTLPLMCRITIDGEATSFSCKVRVPAANWNAKLERLQSKTPEAEKVNIVLDSMRARLYSIYFEQMQSKGYATPMAALKHIVALAAGDGLIRDMFLFSCFTGLSYADRECQQYFGAHQYKDHPNLCQNYKSETEQGF